VKVKLESKPAPTAENSSTSFLILIADSDIGRAAKNDAGNTRRNRLFPKDQIPRDLEKARGVKPTQCTMIGFDGLLLKIIH